MASSCSSLLSQLKSFRTTFAGALSYFVGGNGAYPEDTGFALSPWKSVSFDIIGIVYGSSRAIVQTKTTLTKTDGSSVAPYFSMAFTKTASGDLKLDLHHSSLPPTPATVKADSTSTADNDNDSDKSYTGVSIAAIVVACVGITVAIGALIAFFIVNERLKGYAPVGQGKYAPATHDLDSTSEANNKV